MRELWQKLTTGLKDYCCENGFSDVLLGLSGGIDSALTAVIAADALGAEHVHALMMRTKNTSSLSTQIAAEIARLNGFDYRNVDIQPIIDAQKDFLCSLFDEKPKNIVLENLQARERGKILMAVSNQRNYLLLACGNRSETAMGYCTLYGDTCGGWRRLQDFTKHRFMNWPNGGTACLWRCRPRSSYACRQPNFHPTRKIRTACHLMVFWTVFWLCIWTNKNQKQKSLRPDTRQKQSDGW